MLGALCCPGALHTTRPPPGQPGAIAAAALTCWTKRLDCVSIKSLQDRYTPPAQSGARLSNDCGSSTPDATKTPAAGHPVAIAPPLVIRITPIGYGDVYGACTPATNAPFARSAVPTSAVMMPMALPVGHQV